MAIPLLLSSHHVTAGVCLSWTSGGYSFITAVANPAFSLHKTFSLIQRVMKCSKVRSPFLVPLQFSCIDCWDNCRGVIHLHSEEVDQWMEPGGILSLLSLLNTKRWSVSRSGFPVFHPPHIFVWESRGPDYMFLFVCGFFSSFFLLYKCIFSYSV